MRRRSRRCRGLRFRVGTRCQNRTLQASGLCGLCAGVDGHLAAVVSGPAAMRVGGAPPPPVMLPGSALADDVEDAEDPESSDARLSALAGHYSTEVRMRVAGNRSAPPAALARLAHDTDVFVAANAASNTSAPPEVLEEIVRRDCAASVRQQLAAAVAENPAASSGLLAGLASDDDPVVRHAAAKNQSTPAGSLAALGADPVEWVRVAAAQNPSTPAAGKAAKGLLAD